MKRIAIMGAGSLGTIFGAYLAKAGKDVVLIDAYREHVDALNQKGAVITGKVNMVVPVRAITPDQMEGIYDLIFYLAKQTFNDQALPQIGSHIGPESVVCTCQNGLPERALVHAFGANRVYGAPVGWGATFQGPGCSELTSDPAIMTFYLGAVDGVVTEKLLETKSIMECMCPVHLSENLMGLRWMKLLVNATHSGLSACFGAKFGEIWDNDRSMRLDVKIGAECLAVAKALGVMVEPHSAAGDLRKVFVADSEDALRRSMDLVRNAWTPQRGLIASMAQDLARGKQCEISAINGVVCACGAETGVPTPVNDRVVSVVERIQSGVLTSDFENLSLFEDLC